MSCSFADGTCSDSPGSVHLAQQCTRSGTHCRITDASIWWLSYLDEATATLQQLSWTQKHISRSVLWVSYVLLESADLQYSGCAKLTVSTDWVDKLTHAYTPVSHYCIWESVSHDQSRLSTVLMHRLCHQMYRWAASIPKGLQKTKYVHVVLLNNSISMSDRSYLWR